MEVTYVKIPLGHIPFWDIPSLQNLNYKYVYCSYFSLNEFMNLEFSLLSIFDAFESSSEPDVNLDDTPLLFGRVVSETPSKRGEGKSIKLKVVDQNVNREDLPHLKYSNNNLPTGNWFYMKEGNYFVFSGIKSDYEKVRHLEGIVLYNDIMLRVRIVIELLKRNVNEGLITLSKAEFLEIAFKVFRSDPVAKKINDDIIWSGINNWIPRMLEMPIYEDIPQQYRERVKLD